MTTPAPPIPCPLAEPPGCCAFCCDFNTAYAGRTMTYSYDQMSAWSDDNRVRTLEEFTGIHIGGGVFSGTKRRRTWTGSFAGLTCYDWGSPSLISDVSGLSTASMACDPSQLYYFVTGLLGSGIEIHTAAQSPNCGFTQGCSGFQVIETTCVATHTSSCFAINGQQTECSKKWGGNACTGQLERVRSTQLTINVSIA